MTYRAEVEKAIRRSRAECESEIGLITLGVRLGVTAQKALTSREIDAAWNSYAADPQWGAAQQAALSALDSAIDANPIDPASVLKEEG